MDDLGLVEAVDGLGESVVLGISDAADGGLNPRFDKALGVAALYWASRDRRQEHPERHLKTLTGISGPNYRRVLRSPSRSTIC